MNADTRGEPDQMSGLRDRFAVERDQMVDQQIEARGISDPLVLSAMRKIPRHLFVPPDFVVDAYKDHPITLSEAQATISQPYIVAYMTEALRLTGNERVLEVGTGSGYQAAILAGICREVYTVERYRSLSEEAADRLRTLGYDNVTVRTGDGSLGLPEYAPFDAIMVTAMRDEIPQPLKEQLAPGGRLIMPVGDPHSQNLILLKRCPDDRFEREVLLPVVFVPLVSLHTDT
ncbi:MAG: protein-L-isoaspartate(D-aspartate) O-methyltransferase [bacterium]